MSLCFHCRAFLWLATILWAAVIPAQVDPLVERGVAREFHAEILDPAGAELELLWERVRNADKAVLLFLEPALKKTWEKSSEHYAKNLTVMTVGIHSQRQSELGPQVAELREALSALAGRADFSLPVIEKEGYPLMDQLAELHRIDWGMQEERSMGLASERQTLRRIADIRGRLASVLKRNLSTEAADLEEIEFFALVEGIAAKDARPLLRRNQEAISSLSARERKAHREYNFYRICLGKLPRQIDLRMVEAAQEYSKERRTLGFNGHQSPVEGRETTVDRATSYQIKIRQEFTAASEDERVSRILLLVPAYYRTLLENDGDRFGFGVSGGFWTQYLGPGK